MLLDLFGSMNYVRENGFKRLDYAKNLIASLAYMANQQGDFPILCYVSDGKVEAKKVGPSPKAFSAKLSIKLEQDSTPVLGRQ